jgi:MoxR-like ATPase
MNSAVRFMEIDPGYEVRLPGRGSRPDQVHVFDRDAIDAIDAALAAQRPLLVRGEPGIGKSQLARAAAKHLGRVFVSHSVDARTESSDLLWHYDAVARLADAQRGGALGEAGKPLQKRSSSVRRYLHPGPLWWAFDWTGAKAQADLAKVGGPFQEVDPKAPLQPDPIHGCTVLIDEIDKAESDVPNGLLEALGSGEFLPPGCSHPVVAQAEAPPPLIVITTNNERALPDAFVRRCLVLRLELPESTPAELRNFLVARGARHFPQTDPEILELAAGQLADDRGYAREHRQLPLPGQAEYLDLLRAVTELEPDPQIQIERIKTVARFAFRKHPDARR